MVSGLGGLVSPPGLGVWVLGLGWGWGWEGLSSCSCSVWGLFGFLGLVLVWMFDASKYEVTLPRGYADTRLQENSR